MVDTSARLLRLLSLLQTPREWTGAELAERLDVDVRTVRRDVDRLRRLGYPVDARPGVAGYRLGAGAGVPPLLLDDAEAVAVAVGLSSAADGSVAGIEEASLRALSKLEQVMPSRLRHRVNLLRSVTVAVPATGQPIDPQTLTTIAACCRDHQRLRFDYRSHDGTTSVRSTEPDRLVNAGRRWYLVAWDLDRQAWRTYRIDRVQPRIPTGPRFLPRPAPAQDLAGYVSAGVTTRTYRYQARITLRAPIEVAADRIPQTVGVLEAADSSTCVLRTGSNSLDEIAVYLGLLGLPFRVHEPVELITHLRDLAARLTAAIADSDWTPGAPSAVV